MDRSATAYLIGKTYTQDTTGVMRENVSRRLVYCNIQEASAAEWFEGGRAGLNPSYKVTMFAPDYNGEQLIEIGDTVHQVYRTYHRRTDELELHCQKEAGANAGV